MFPHKVLAYMGHNDRYLCKDFWSWGLGEPDQVSQNCMLLHVLIVHVQWKFMFLLVADPQPLIIHERVLAFLFLKVVCDTLKHPWNLEIWPYMAGSLKIKVKCCIESTLWVQVKLSCYEGGLKIKGSKIDGPLMPTDAQSHSKSVYNGKRVLFMPQKWDQLSF